MKGLNTPEKTVQPVSYLFDPNEAMGTTFEADDVSVIKVAILTRDRAYMYAYYHTLSTILPTKVRVDFS